MDIGSTIRITRNGYVTTGIVTALEPGFALVETKVWGIVRIVNNTDSK